MNTKILAAILLLIFSVCMVNGAFAEEDTAEDMSNYIMPISISDSGIKFNDGFTGFCLDNDKDEITADDGFTKEATGSGENNIKLAIIECYKQNRESDIAKIVESLVSGNPDQSDDVIKEVLASGDDIADYAVVDINNTTQATFNFELLKSANENKSDCLAYSVSFETIETEDESADPEEIEANDTDDSSGDAAPDKADDNANDKSDDNTNDNANDKSKDKAEPEKAVKKAVKEKTDKEKTAKETVKEKTVKEAAKEKTKKEKSDKTTAVNKTSTPVVNETTTTIDNTSNVETFGAPKEVPQNNNAESQSRILNPIPILIILAAVIGLAAVVLYRKD